MKLTALSLLTANHVLLRRPANEQEGIVSLTHSLDSSLANTSANSFGIVW